MSPDKLAYMANQIGKFFAHQKHDAGGRRDRRSSGEVLGPQDAPHDSVAIDAVSEQLDPLVREAIAQLRKAHMS